MALFKLGQIVATRGALAFCEKHSISPLQLITRHASGDWGDICKEDNKANVDALAYDGRILSSYKLYGEKLYCITEWDRSATTLLHANEY
jgi:hypothetical protein